MPAAFVPAKYLVDHLALRTAATQSASLQAIKFFYEFWYQKYGVTFCFSFNSSDHNPLIAIEELTAFFHYLEKILLPAEIMAQSCNSYPLNC